MAALLSLPSLPPSVWRGDQLPGRASVSVATGWSALDRELPGGGWPAGSVGELCVSQPGQGELDLLWPALRDLTESRKHVLLVSPPAIPYAPAWQQAGIVLERLHWIRPDKEEDAWWVLEQALRDRACGMVLAWLPVSPVDRVHRRLRLAAETGGAIGMLLTPDTAAQGSPAALRLSVSPLHDGLEVRILKRRGPPLTRPLLLPLDGDKDAHVMACAVSTPATVGSLSSRSGPMVA